MIRRIHISISYSSNGHGGFEIISLVDMYTNASTIAVKENWIASFVQEGSTLRVLIAITVFGMGVDCLDIRFEIHWCSVHQGC